MQSIYLRFADEDEARGVLGDYSVDGEWRLASHQHALDVVGALYEEGEPLEGFHVNLKLAAYDGVSMETWRVFPASPRRVWA